MLTEEQFWKSIVVVLVIAFVITSAFEASRWRELQQRTNDLEACVNHFICPAADKQ